MSPSQLCLVDPRLLFVQLILSHGSFLLRIAIRIEQTGLWDANALFLKRDRYRKGGKVVRVGSASHFLFLDTFNPHSAVSA